MCAQIAMGTFVLSFIGNGFVRSAQRTMPPFTGAIPAGMRRKFLVLLYFTSIVSCVTLFGVMTIPDIIREAADFVSRLQSDSIWVVVLEKLRQGLGCATLAAWGLFGIQKGALKRLHSDGCVKGASLLLSMGLLGCLEVVAGLPLPCMQTWKRCPPLCAQL